MYVVDAHGHYVLLSREHFISQPAFYAAILALKRTSPVAAQAQPPVLSASLEYLCKQQIKQ